MKLCHRVDFLSKLASRCLSPASRFSGTIEQYRGESSPGEWFCFAKEAGCPSACGSSESWQFSELSALSLQVRTEQRLRHIEIQVTARRRQSIVHTNGGVRNLFLWSESIFPFWYLVMVLRIKNLIILSRVVTKISSCRVNTTSRRGIKRLGISFGSIFQ